MGRVQLALSEPPIRGYLHHAYPLSIMAGHDDFIPWLHSNYIQLYCAKNYESVHGTHFNFYFYNDYHYYPLLRCARIDREVVESVSDILTFIIQSINKGYYLIVYINEYYIPKRPAFGKFHNVHELLISGYDTVTRQFSVSSFADRKYMRYEITFDNLLEAYSKADYRSLWYANDIQLLKIERETTYEFNLPLVLNQLNGYLHSTINYRPALMPVPEDQLACGLEVYRYLKNALISMSKQKMVTDVRPLHILWEHKKCMRERIRYLLDRKMITNEELHTHYKAIESTIDNCRLMFLLYEKSRDQNVLAKIMKKLDEVSKAEKEVLKELLFELTHASN